MRRSCMPRATVSPRGSPTPLRRRRQGWGSRAGAREERRREGVSAAAGDGEGGQRWNAREHFASLVIGRQQLLELTQRVGVAPRQLVVEVGEQLVRISKVEPRASDRDDNDGDSGARGLPQLHQAIRSREHVARGEQDQHVRPAHAEVEESAKVGQVGSVEEHLLAEHRLEQVLDEARLRASLLFVVREEARKRVSLAQLPPRDRPGQALAVHRGMALVERHERPDRDGGAGEQAAEDNGDPDHSPECWDGRHRPDSRG